MLKVLGDATKVANPFVTAGFYLAAAGFVAISFALQTGINKSYLDNQRTARTRWFETLQAYISADERRRIADEPIATAETSYEATKGQIGKIYLALVVVLVGFGLYTLVTGAAAPAPAAKPPPPPAIQSAAAPAAASASAPPPVAPPPPVKPAPAADAKAPQP